MKITPFKLERFFARYEFSVPYLLSCSDCEPVTLKELMKMADPDSLALWYGLSLGYTESQGHPVLREEVTHLYQNIHCDEVLVTAPEEGIFIAMNALLESGDHVIATFPCYQSLSEIARSIGCEVTGWGPDETNGWCFDVESLKSLIRKNTRLIVINFPHNPTGAHLTRPQFDELLRTAEQKDIRIFSDEMYRYLEHDTRHRLPPACDVYENAVSLFGMSKSFGLAGLRIGWLATRNQEVLKKFCLFKDYTTICSSAPSEILAIMALRARDTILARNTGIIRQNLEVLNEFFSRYPDHFDWSPPLAGPIAFPKLTMDAGVSEFCRGLVEKKGVLLLPAEVYHCDHNRFRIGFGRKNLPEALAKFEEYVKECLR